MEYPVNFVIDDKNRPVTFKLPDDQVDLVPWQYIIDRLAANLGDTINALKGSNDALEKIDNRLEELMNGTDNEDD